MNSLSQRSRRFLLLAASLLLLMAGPTGCDREPRVHTSPMAAGASPKEAGARSDMDWKTDFKGALAEASKLNKPVMVDFFATWCGPCKMLDRETYSNPKVIEAAQTWISVKIDVDKEPELASRYQVRSIPTIAFLRPDGSFISQHVGFADANEMLIVMKEAYSKAEK
jgi:thiol:disulfide interchange protein